MSHPITTETLEQADLGVRFYALIEGIPYVFLDGATPVGPDGTAWAAPDDANGNAYTLLQNCLDTDAMPIKDPGVMVTRSTSDVSAASMRLLLRDVDDTLLGLFGRHRTDVVTGQLDASLSYAATSLTALDTTGWATNDLLYLGRETMRVTGVTSGTVLAVERGCYGLDYSRTRYDMRPSRPAAPRMFANAPRVWHGRYIRVVAYLVNAATGVALGDGFGMVTAPFAGGAVEWEVWRGFLTAAPRATADWSSWELHADGLEAILRTEVGYESMTASLLRVATWADTLTANRKGAIPEPASAPGADQAAIWVSRDNTRAHIRVTAWASVADYASNTSPVVYDYTGAAALTVYDSAGELVSATDLLNAWRTSVSDTLVTDTGCGPVELVLGSGGLYAWSFAPGPGVFEFTFRMGPVDSLGQLFGVTGDFSGVSAPGDGMQLDMRYASEDGTALAINIPPTARSIPFYYDGAGVQQETPPTPGFAIIGDDDTAEIVAYDAISTLAATTQAGVYVMTGVSRGRCGTVPKHFWVTMAQQNAGTEAVKVRFGLGWSATNAATILLQLLSSGPSGEEWNAYDVLAPGATPGLNPSHVDVGAFEAMGARFVAWEGLRSFVLTKSMRLGELAAQLLQPLGYWLVGATGADGQYQLRPIRSLPALDSSAVLAITERHMVSDKAPAMTEAGAVVNELKVLYRWRPVANEFDENAYVDIIDRDSEAEFGARKKLEWKLIGMVGLDAGTAYSASLSWAFGMFARFGRPYDILRMEIGRVGWSLQPGDTVTVTLPGLPTTFGERGVDRAATVLQAAKTYSGQSPTVDVTLVLEAPDRHTAYCPAARITAWSSGTPAAATFSTTEFATAPDTDGAHFRAGDVVWVYRLDYDATTRVTRTINTISGTSVTFTSGLPLSFVAGTDTLVTFADYASVTTRQRKFAFQADSTPALGASPTEPVQYV